MNEKKVFPFTVVFQKLAEARAEDGALCQLSDDAKAIAAEVKELENFQRFLDEQSKELSTYTTS